LLSVIVVSWNTRELLRECLASVETQLARADHETIVVDNASADGSGEMVAAEFPRVRLIRSAANVGFGRGNNIGMAEARGEFFLLLNSDARLVDASLLRLAELLRGRPEVGVVGPRLRFEDGRLQWSAHRFASPGRLALEELGLYKLLAPARRAEVLLGGYWDHDREREVDWVTGACMMLRRAVFEQTGGFDPRIFLYGEEVEWCHRIRGRGWTIVFSPAAEAIHRGHASAHRLMDETGRIDRCLLADDRMIAAWHGLPGRVLAPVIRVAGALLKLAAFGVRRLARDDAYGRDVMAYSRVVLGHYARRVSGRLRIEA
jgi:hypothetical protein